MEKLKSQKAFLPASIFESLTQYLISERAQHTLNELFHLLKKYDLLSTSEQEERNEKLVALVK